MTPEKMITVFTPNGLGIMLLIVLFFSYRGQSMNPRDNSCLMKLIAISFLACVADPIAYIVDGKPGFWVTAVIYVGNTWLFLANILTGKIWVRFITEHLNISISKKHQAILELLCLIGILFLFVNLRYPIIFTVKDNVYSRTYFYWIFVCIAGLHMIDSVIIYRRAKRTRGALIFFPIGIFLIPVALGTLVQSLFYGVSVIWPSVAIAVAGTIIALKNEIIFRDHLTGLFNRNYLDFLRKIIKKSKSLYITGIMIDLNEFKSINDKFGHAVGDEALIEASRIMSSTIGDQGNVIRYAGDEFIILLNTVDEEIVESTIKKLQQAFIRFNQSKSKPYMLSASMGYSSLDVKNQSMNDFMNVIDSRMYENKAKYYQEEYNGYKE